MSEVIINNAPIKFRKYLKMADANNKGQNGSNDKIDTKEEVEAATKGYCKENPNKCQEVFKFLKEASDYSPEEILIKPPKWNRKLRFLFSLSVGILSVDWFNYGSLKKDIRSVPPHPDDVNAITEPIDAKGDFTSISFEVSLDFAIDFWQYVFLKYQMGFKPTVSDEEIRGGSYNYTGGYPLLHRQEYASGENAFTFVSLEQQNKTSLRTHYLTLGFYAFRKKEYKFDIGGHEAGEESITIDAGLAVRKFSVIRGWDRYASIEIMDKKEMNLWGAAFGINFQCLMSPGKSFWLGINSGIRIVYFPDGAFSATFNLVLPIGFEAF